MGSGLQVEPSTYRCVQGREEVGGTMSTQNDPNSADDTWPWSRKLRIGKQGHSVLNPLYGCTLYMLSRVVLVNWIQ